MVSLEALNVICHLLYYIILAHSTDPHVIQSMLKETCLSTLLPGGSRNLMQGQIPAWKQNENYQTTLPFLQTKHK